MAWLHPSDRFAWSDLVALVLISAMLYDLAGLAGAMVAFALINLRLIIAPLYVVVIAHLGLAALLPPLPPLAQFAGFEAASILLLGRPFLNDTTPGQSLLLLTGVYAVLVGVTSLLISVTELVWVPGLIVIAGIGLALYAIHRLEVTRLPMEGEPQ